MARENKTVADMLRDNMLVTTAGGILVFRPIVRPLILRSPNVQATRGFPPAVLKVAE